MKVEQHKSVTKAADRLNPSKDGRSRMLCVQDYRSTADSFACGKQKRNRPVRSVVKKDSGLDLIRSSQIR